MLYGEDYPRRAWLIASLGSSLLVTPTVGQASWISPASLAAVADPTVLFVACNHANRIALLDRGAAKLSTPILVPASPTGLALSADGTRLYVTCAAPRSQVCVVNTVSRKTIDVLVAGHTATSPVLSKDGRMLYVCNRFDEDVSLFDLELRKEVTRIPVEREPVSADITTDGKYLLVANHLPKGRADVTSVAAVVSVIDTATARMFKELKLPNGSGSLHDLRVSPDGRYALVTHLVARFNRLPTRVTGGWMHVNAMTLIDLSTMEIRKTFLLDDPYSGAANPWGIAWSADGATVVVTHAGTHEISVIDFQSLLEQLSLPPPADAVNGADPGSSPPAEQPDYLPFFSGRRQRLKLPANDLGPRAVVISGRTAYVANYFSDTLTAVDLPSGKFQNGATRGTNVTATESWRPAVSIGFPNVKMESIQLGAKSEMTLARKGEMYFNDARLCYDGWQSCASCHPGDARCDGLNWDLLNDGIGNPKNTKSLLLAFETPPAMSLGVRETAETAVRAGLSHILFTKQPEEVALAIDAYLKSLKPVPSPYLVGGQLSASAARGKSVFARAGCAECHPPKLFTNLHQYDVGTANRFDKATDKFDTPTLVELWRTAPYLHDGSAATIRDVVTTRNPRDQHGHTSHLCGKEVDDLCAYLMSL